MSDTTHPNGSAPLRIVAEEWDDLADEFQAMADRAQTEARSWHSRATHARQQARMIREATHG